MYTPSSEPPKPLPEVQLTELAPGVTLLAPLSRRGHGPGILLLTSDSTEVTSIHDGVPAPSVKWGEEGFAVVEIQASALAKDGAKLLTTGLEALGKFAKCDGADKVGLVAYEPASWLSVLPSLPSIPQIVAAVVYTDVGLDLKLGDAKIPVVTHLAGPPPASTLPKRTPALTEYFYAAQTTHRFARPFAAAVFHYADEAVSHTRNLTFLKPKVDGPFFDLEAIWEEHTWYEFADRSVEHTMATMVQEPYVNHIPTITGGIGRANLTNFYRDHFIFSNPDDAELELVSRTIGIDRVVDEFVYKCTHARAIDWLAPGVPPTGKKIEVPMSAVVNIRGDRLYHEHIAWDQGSVLRQLDLLPEYLPYPYPLQDGRTAAAGKAFQYRLPVDGINTAKKMREKNAVASNAMLEYDVKEV